MCGGGGGGGGLVDNSNLVSRKSKCYFIIIFSLLLSTRLKWRGIRPDIGKTAENEFVASFYEMTTQRSGFGQNSCAADEQACVLDNSEFNKNSVLNIFMINGLNLQTLLFTSL